MLNKTLVTQLETHLKKLVQPIKLVAALDESTRSRELDALLHKITELSDKISLRH